jgi:DtxR family transcriptional regulator, Mn-dependent transcriptional regulator
LLRDKPSTDLQPAVTQAVEDYLKVIYKLQQESGIATNSEVSRRMGTSPAAATKMIKQLAERQLVEYEPYQGVRLTPVGEKVALEIIRHHRLLELYLHQALGYGWDEVDAEAEQLEHHISEELEERINQMLGNPTTDPHGDPIPTREGVMPPTRGISLAESEPGDMLVVLRVSDRSSEVLRYLAQIGMRLEVEVEILEKQPFNGPLTVRIGDATMTVGRELAGHVFVERRQTEPALSGHR